MLVNTNNIHSVHSVLCPACARTVLLCDKSESCLLLVVILLCVYILLQGAGGRDPGDAAGARLLWPS